MRFVIVMMLILIGGSFVIEWVMPRSFKDAAGAVIAWSLMFITMTFLTLSTIGLAIVIGRGAYLALTS